MAVTGPRSRLEQRLVALIDGASDMVVVYSFLLSSQPVADALHSANGRGVRCYMLTASEELLAKPSTLLNEFDRRRIADHRKLLDALSRFALVRTAPHFHAKGVLVDPLTNPGGWLSTANLVTSSFERSDDLAVELTADETRAHFDALRWSFWESSAHELAGPGVLAACEPAGLAPRPTDTAALYAVEGYDGIASHQLALLARAPSRVLACNFGWDLADPLVADLIELATSGTDVVVVGRPDQRSSQTALEALSDAGATVRGRDRMHAKVLVADDRAVVSTANFTGPTAGNRFELGISLEPDDRRISCVRSATRHWAETAPWSLAHV